MFGSKMFGIRRLALVAPLVGMVAFIAPIQAAAEGATAGVVTGTVSLTPGLLPTLAVQSFTFNSNSIVAAFANSSTACAGDGSLSVSATGGSTLGENTAEGVGKVSALTGSGSVTTGTSGCPAGSTVSVSLLPDFLSDNTYVRIGAVVWVWLWIQICITTPLGTVWINAWVYVKALFRPTSGNGVTTPATAASFTGAFAGAEVP